MRVWFDLLTPKQLLFFGPVIDILEKGGHQVLATSRRYREVEQMSELLGIGLTFAGERGGKDILGQFKRSLERMEQLLPTVVSFSPQAAVSVASADCARISFGLRVKHVAVNDSPHSAVADRLSLPLSHHLITPWIIPYSAWQQYGVARGQISRYRALDPAAWLKRRQRVDRPPAKDGGATILVRLEESYAPYLAGSDQSWTEKVLDKIARDFKGNDLVVLCRYEDQLESVKKRFGSSFTVPDTAVDGAGLIERSDVFLGMGGTMTTEAALLGVPAVSAFQGGQLYTEKFLLSRRLLLKARSLGAISRCIEASLRPAYRDEYRRRARALLEWMDDPAAKVANYISTLAPAAR